MPHREDTALLDAALLDYVTWSDPEKKLRDRLEVLIESYKRRHAKEPRNVLREELMRARRAYKASRAKQDSWFRRHLPTEIKDFLGFQRRLETKRWKYLRLVWVEEELGHLRTTDEILSEIVVVKMQLNGRKGDYRPHRSTTRRQIAHALSL